MGSLPIKGLPRTHHLRLSQLEKSHASITPEGTEFHIGKIEMVANTGTYLDSPFHRFTDFADLSQLNLEQTAHLEGVLVRIPAEHERVIDATHTSSGLDVRGKAVLVHTGWSRHWNTNRYFEDHPFLTAEAARIFSRTLAQTLVGIDSYNIDDTDDGVPPGTYHFTRREHLDRRTHAWPGTDSRSVIRSVSTRYQSRSRTLAHFQCGLSRWLNKERSP